MPSAVALVREISPALARCELTHLTRVPIDVALAEAQHANYVEALAEAGCRVERLPTASDLPDSVFIEDIAIVFDELAIITRPGAESRRGETPVVADAVARYREVRRIEAPGTIDGGDVLVCGRQVFVGESTRTNAAAIEQMRGILGPFGYTVCPLRVGGYLHLKSAVTLVAERLLLANPAWIDGDAFRGYKIVGVAAGEPAAANALGLRDRVILPAAFPRTAERLRAHGLTVTPVDVGELAKAEGGVTCCSLIVNEPLATQD